MRMGNRAIQRNRKGLAQIALIRENHILETKTRDMRTDSSER